MNQLDGLSIVITGTSSGIGKAIAHRFWEEGARLTLGSRTEPEIGAGSRWLETDVTDPNAADALIQAAVDTYGKIDVLVNNAGVQVEKSIVDTSDDEFDQIIAVNLKGVFNCARAAVRTMSTQPGGGSIINIGSISGNTADRAMAVYNASKGAVHSLTRSIAIDHGRDGIRCNAIAPGWIDTNLAAAGFSRAIDPAAARARAIDKHPIGRLGAPEDIASLAVWLAGGESVFASGSIFTVDGGLTAQNSIG